jgi:hypothetical protein
MKLIRFIRTSLLLISAAALASCGGGGDDEAGANTAFSVSPTNFAFGWGATGCGASQLNDIVEVFVIGGTAPYQVKVSNPSLVSVDKTVVPKGGSFKVTYLASGICFDPSTITVEDDLDRAVTVTLVSELAE